MSSNFLLMKYQIFSVLLIVGLLYSCNQEEIITSFDRDQTEVQVTSRSSSFEHRGIYVNDFRTSILGDIAEEDYLLEWCDHHNFNRMTLYNISAILDDPAETDLLEDFMEKANLDYPHIRINFVVSSADAISEVDDYCLSNPVSLHPHGVATEYEFWNDPWNYTTYDDMLNDIEILTDAGHSGWKNQLYISRFEDAAEVVSDEDVLKQVIIGVDEIHPNKTRILLVNYRPNAYNFFGEGTGSYNRLVDMAGEAESQGLNHLSVVILFNVNYLSGDPDIFDYFDEEGGDHAFEDAMLNFKEGFDAADFPNKNKIRLRGYQIYRYTQAREARGL